MTTPASSANADRVARLAAALASATGTERTGSERTYMEVCGTHTMAISRAGLRADPRASACSGPGCPVCVTPMGYVDAAVALARRPA